jgi:hypothetical protein
MFEPGVAIALELLALCAGAFLILLCHRDRSQPTVFPKFIAYFTVILAFLALIGSIISCFIFWMDGGTRDFGIDRGRNYPPPATQSYIPDHQDAIRPELNTREQK